MIGEMGVDSLKQSEVIIILLRLVAFEVKYKRPHLLVTHWQY